MSLAASIEGDPHGIGAEQRKSAFRSCLAGGWASAALDKLPVAGAL